MAHTDYSEITMKIFLPYKEEPKTGKGLFIKRLHDEFIKMGIRVILKPSEKSDIALHVTKMKYKTNSKKNIVRFNGVYHDKKIDYKYFNSQIRTHADKADALIFQSKFGQQMFEKYIGKYKNKPRTVIFNGSTTQDNAKTIQSKFKYNFLAFSRWRPHKRLKATIKSFLASDMSDSCLWIAGDLKESGLKRSKIKKYFQVPRVQYLGILNGKSLGRYIASSNAIIHICWLDWCPNSVVESICAGKTVICNNVGGTQEIVRPSGGIVCDIDEPYDLEPINLLKPPRINTHIVADSIVKSANDLSMIKSDHVDINNIAKEYKSFFEKVLED